MSLQKPLSLESIGVAERTRKPLLCVHGLNQRPAAMKPLLFDLKNQGFQPYLLHLPGHDEQNNYKSLVPENFLQAYKDSYNYICEFHNTKPYFLGYSFGGLIGLNCFHQHPLEKTLLLAPALRIHFYTLLLKPILAFVKKVHSAPLGNSEYEKIYRFHQSGVPVEIYQSFFKIYQNFLNKDLKCLETTEALILTHPGDELVSYRGLQQLVKKFEKWKLEPLNNDMAEFKKFNHLCFDKRTLGEESYANMLQKLCRYFLH